MPTKNDNVFFLQIVGSLRCTKPNMLNRRIVQTSNKRKTTRWGTKDRRYGHPHDNKRSNRSG